MKKKSTYVQYPKSHYANYKCCLFTSQYYKMNSVLAIRERIYKNPYFSKNFKILSNMIKGLNKIAIHCSI